MAPPGSPYIRNIILFTLSFSFTIMTPLSTTADEVSRLNVYLVSHSDVAVRMQKGAAEVSAQDDQHHWQFDHGEHVHRSHVVCTVHSVQQPISGSRSKTVFLQLINTAVSYSGRMYAGPPLARNYNLVSGGFTCRASERAGSSWYVTTLLYYGGTIASLSLQTRETWYSEYTLLWELIHVQCSPDPSWFKWTYF